MSMILYYEKRQDRKDGLIFKITALSFLFVPLGFIAQLIARIGMYLQVSMIATYPLMIRTINKENCTGRSTVCNYAFHYL